MSFVRRLVVGLGGLVFGLAIGLLILVAIMIQFLDYQLVRVDSDSMEPAFERGDLVAIQPVSAENVEDGDVILFRTEVGASVMHRVVGRNEIVTNVQNQEGEIIDRVTEYQFVTQGDANPSPDAERIPGQNVQGKVWFSVPLLGGADTFSLQFFLLLMAGVIILAWISYEGYRFFGRREQKGNASESNGTSTNEQG